MTRSVGREAAVVLETVRDAVRSGPACPPGPRIPAQCSPWPPDPPRIPDWERGVWLDAGRSHLPPRGLNGGSYETAERKGSVRPVGRSRNTVWASFQAEAGLPQKPLSIPVLQLVETPQCPFKHHPHLSRLPTPRLPLNPCSRYETQVTDVGVLE